MATDKRGKAIEAGDCLGWYGHLYTLADINSDETLTLRTTGGPDRIAYQAEVLLAHRCRNSRTPLNLYGRKW